MLLHLVPGGHQPATVQTPAPLLAYARAVTCSCYGCWQAQQREPANVARPSAARAQPYHWPQVQPFQEGGVVMRPAWPKVRQ